MRLTNSQLQEYGTFKVDENGPPIMISNFETSNMGKASNKRAKRTDDNNMLRVN